MKTKLTLALALAIAGAAPSAMPARADSLPDDSTPVDGHMVGGALVFEGSLGNFIPGVAQRDGASPMTYSYTAELSYSDGQANINCGLSYTFDSAGQRPPADPKRELRITHVESESSQLQMEITGRPFLTKTTASFRQGDLSGALRCERRGKEAAPVTLGDLRLACSATDAKVTYRPGDGSAPVEASARSKRNRGVAGKKQ